jgi:hypothetical protein
MAADYLIADAYWQHQPQHQRTMEWFADLDDAAARAIGHVLAPRQDLLAHCRQLAAGWTLRSNVLANLLGN